MGVDEFFRYATTLTYWLLVCCWVYILAFYAKRFYWHWKKEYFLTTLILILIIDSFRTLFESLYFGIRYSSVQGFLPSGIYDLLIQPQYVFFPKLFNLLAAFLIIFIVLRRWIPHEEYLRKQSQEKITKAQKEVALTKEQYREFVEGTSDLVTQVNQEGVITYTNSVSEKVWGFKPEECIGRLAFDLTHPEDRESTRQAFDEWIRGNIDTAAFTNRQLDKEGNTHILNWTINLHYDEKGELKSINSIAKDVTEEVFLKKKDEERRQLLIQQSKLADMGNMISVISHQWKQPLNLMMLLSDMADDEIDFSEDPKKVCQEFSASVKQQIIEMNDTMERFRNFFKPGVEKEIFKACEEVVEVTRMLSALLKSKGVSVNVCEHEHFAVAGYVSEFKQVIVNIIQNAVDVFEEKALQKRVIEVRFEKHAAEAAIIIEDSGGGIPEMLLPNKLFEPYSTTKGDKGTGIGLNIAKIIIEKNMHGSLTAANTNEGACFTITLPTVNQQDT